MPFIHIKSLPMEESIDIPDVITGIAGDFASTMGIELQHIHTTWEYYQPGHYAKGDNTASLQPPNNFPLIVDLLTPDFINDKSIVLMLETIAKSISSRAQFPENNIFINHRLAHSSRVFDDGEIVRW